MVKVCFMCDKAFNDGDDIVAIVRSQFKSIPSRVSYAIATPTDAYELQHYECAKGDLLPDDLPETEIID